MTARLTRSKTRILPRPLPLSAEDEVTSDSVSRFSREAGGGGGERRTRARKLVGKESLLSSELLSPPPPLFFFRRLRCCEGAEGARLLLLLSGGICWLCILWLALAKKEAAAVDCSRDPIGPWRVSTYLFEDEEEEGF